MYLFIQVTQKQVRVDVCSTGHRAQNAMIWEVRKMTLNRVFSRRASSPCSSQHWGAGSGFIGVEWQSRGRNTRDLLGWGQLTAKRALYQCKHPYLFPGFMADAADAGHQDQPDLQPCRSFRKRFIEGIVIRRADKRAN